MSRTTWIIVVADNKVKHWPAASKLLGVGVPLAIARRYQIVRHDMTAGLKRRIAASKN